MAARGVARPDRGEEAVADVVRDPEKPKRLSLLRVVTNVKAKSRTFPCHSKQLCVFSQLTECRGTLLFRVDVFHPESEKILYAAPIPPVDAGTGDPLAVRGVSIRIKDVIFQSPGLYSVRLWLEGDILAEHPLLVQ